MKEGKIEGEKVKVGQKESKKREEKWEIKIQREKEKRKKKREQKQVNRKGISFRRSIGRGSIAWRLGRERPGGAEAGSPSYQVAPRGCTSGCRVPDLPPSFPWLQCPPRPPATASPAKQQTQLGRGVPPAAVPASARLALKLSRSRTGSKTST